MIKDRYGTALYAENSITVLDFPLDNAADGFEDDLGWKLRDFDQQRYSSAYQMDFGSGADWVATAYEVLNELVPFSAIAAAFFFGERIEKSAFAWKRMASILLSCFSSDGFTDANGAALLALEQVFEKTGATNVKLLAYTWVDEEIELFDEANKAISAFEIIARLDEIQSRDRQFEGGLYSTPVFLFKFEVEGKVVLASVRKKEVTLADK